VVLEADSKRLALCGECCWRCRPAKPGNKAHRPFSGEAANNRLIRGSCHIIDHRREVDRHGVGLVDDRKSQ